LAKTETRDNTKLLYVFVDIICMRNYFIQTTDLWRLWISRRSHIFWVCNSSCASCSNNCLCNYCTLECSRINVKRGKWV